MAHGFTRIQLLRLGRLLDMLYKPSEVAEELGMTTAMICRSCLPKGAPFTRDKAGNIWIHGQSFAGWVRELQKKRHQGRLADGQAWCFNCKGPVEMVKPRKRHSSRYTIIYQGRCQVCGQVVNRAYAASWMPGKTSPQPSPAGEGVEEVQA